MAEGSSVSQGTVGLSFYCQAGERRHRADIDSLSAEGEIVGQLDVETAGERAGKHAEHVVVLDSVIGQDAQGPAPGLREPARRSVP